MNHHVPADIISAMLCAIVLFIAPTSSKAEDWSKTDKALIASFIVLETIDVAQTKRCLKLPNCTEGNPIFGKHPSDGQLVAGKTIAVGAIYWLADSYPEYRTGFLIGANLIQSLVVRHNYIGAQVGWGF